MTATLQAEIPQIIHVPEQRAGTEQPRRQDSLLLAALPTAIGCARSLVTLTLDDWKAPLLINNAVHLSDCLVSSVLAQAESLHHLSLLRLRLLGYARFVIIEVRDEIPEQLPQLDGTTHPGNLLLWSLREVSKRWGSYPFGNGKITWAEPLPMYPMTERNLPIRPPTPTPHPRDSPDGRPSLDLLRRVRGGLENL